MDTIKITVAENDPDVIVSATLNEDAVTITLNEAATGATGAGVPTGGFENNILKKTSSTNYATEWETPTSAATASTIVRRDEYGGVEFVEIQAYRLFTTETAGQIWTIGANSDIFAEHPSSSVKSYNFAAIDATAGAALRDSDGTAYLTWGATAGNISITVDTTSTGHFLSNPGTATAGHFITKNGTAPTIVAGRSAWFSNSSGDPQFRNGTSSAITLVYSGGPLGTPSSGTLTSCTGLPIATGISGLGANVATLLTGTPSGTGGVVGTTSPTFVTGMTTPIANVSGTNSYNLTNGTSPDGGSSALLFKAGATTQMSIDSAGSFILAGSAPFMAVNDRTNGSANRMGFYSVQNTANIYSVSLTKNLFSIGTTTGRVTIANTAYNYNGNTAVTAKCTIVGEGTTTNPTLDAQDSAGTSAFKVLDNGDIALRKTITAAATTGAQTINKPSGSVNFAASATSLVVTNSLCTTSSVINATIATNDATANGLRVVAAAGSFTIHMLVAPTAETRVNFILTN